MIMYPCCFPRMTSPVCFPKLEKGSKRDYCISLPSLLGCHTTFQPLHNAHTVAHLAYLSILEGHATCKSSWLLKLTCLRCNT